MKRSLGPVFGTTLGLFLAAAAAAPAAPVEPPPATWKHSWIRGQIAVAPTAGLGSISFTDQAELTATGASQVIGSIVTPAVSDSTTEPDVYTGVGFSLTLNLVDELTGGSGAITFNGTLSGTISAGGTLIDFAFSNLEETASFTSGSGDDMKQVDYSVTVQSSTIGQVGGAPGNIQFLVTPTVRQGGDGDPDPDPSDAPEPSTMVLAGLGLAGLGLAKLRRRAAV
jgi:hypothetical protein